MSSGRTAPPASFTLNASTATKPSGRDCRTTVTVPIFSRFAAMPTGRARMGRGWSFCRGICFCGLLGMRRSDVILRRLSGLHKGYRTHRPLVRFLLKLMSCASASNPPTKTHQRNLQRRANFAAEDSAKGKQMQPLDINANYCVCPACEGSGSGQGDQTYCGFCGGDGSVPEWAVRQFEKATKQKAPANTGK